MRIQLASALHLEHNISTMANVQGASVTGALSIFGFVAIYGVIMKIIINACFDLVQVIPDQVIGFVGAGSVSTKLGADTEGKINSMFLMTARMGPQRRGGGGSKEPKIAPNSLNWWPT